jgi:lipid II:glycine glycyltransferase (peptidoglycan interpeptide bridge formation enzyme)
MIDTHLALCDDRTAWNAFVSNSPYGHVLQSWEWGELKARAGQEPVRLVLRDGGTIRAAVQVLVRPLARGLGRIAYVPKGPVLDYEDPDLLTAVLDGLSALARQRRVISLKIEPEIRDPSPVTAGLLRYGLQPAPPVQMRSTIWVDLTAPEEEILARQHHKTRYNTRLAQRKGVEVTAGTVEDIDAWYDMYEVTAQRDGFSIHGREYYRQVMETLGARDMARLFVARHEGDLLAGTIAFAFGHLAQYMYGASSNTKRNLMAPYLTQWRGMQWAKERGCRIYDLWGIPDVLEENEDLWGVYRHKRGYGGEIVRYIGAFDLVRSPLQHLALERVARPLFKRVARLSV